MTTLAVIEGRERACVQHCRAEDMLRATPDRSVNLLWCDPPYFRVVDEEWDRAWKTERAYLDWLRGIVAECARVLAPNGSLYLFASATMGARVEVMTGEYLRVLNSIVWDKAHADYAPGDPQASALKVRNRSRERGWLAFSERVVFAERRYGAASAVGDAVEVARTAARLSRSQLEVRLGRVSATDPKRGTSLVYRWEVDGPGACVPTCDDFVRAMRVCGDPRSEGRLRAEYEQLLRPFDAPESFADVWTHTPPPSSPTRHVCEKPAAMLRDVVLASSRPGELVYEPFAGSFRMAEVALAEGRRYLGCDADAHWASVGQERVRAVCNGTAAAVPARAVKTTDARQPNLFGGAL